MVGGADMPVHVLATVETILDLFAVFVSPLNIVGCFLEIFVHDVFLFEISDLTNAVIFKSRQLIFLFIGMNLFISSSPCPLFLFSDEMEELLNILDWIKVLFLIVLAARAIHELVLLATELFNNTLEFWCHVSLSLGISLEVLDVSGELLEVVLGELAFLRL